VNPLLHQLNNDLVNEWNKFLKPQSVKFPTSKNRLLQLLCLFRYFPNPVSQNEMEQWIREHGGDYNRQARHLAWDGWYIQTGNSNSTRMEISTDLRSDQLQLVSLSECNPIWIKYNHLQITNATLHPEFATVFALFSGRGCAICGLKTIFLQPYSNLSKNRLGLKIVPICSSCNEWCEEYSISLLLSENLIARPKITL